MQSNYHEAISRQKEKTIVIECAIERFLLCTRGFEAGESIIGENNAPGQEMELQTLFKKPIESMPNWPIIN